LYQVSSRGAIYQISPTPQATIPPHLAVSVSEDVSPAAPKQQQWDDWDILKAIVYGGLVETITSLSVVSAAVSMVPKHVSYSLLHTHVLLINDTVFEF